MTEFKLKLVAEMLELKREKKSLEKKVDDLKELIKSGYPNPVAEPDIWWDRFDKLVINN